MKNPIVIEKVKRSYRLTRSLNPEKYNDISRRNFKVASDKRIGQKDTEEVIEKRRQSLLNYFSEHDHASKGKTMSQSEIDKLKSGWTDDVRKRHSEVHKELAKKKDMGALTRGMKRSEEFKKQRSKDMKKRWENAETGTCPHCGKCGILRALKRWHFDNCKEKV